MQKIILYYKFVPVADPAMTMRWQRELCTRLNLRGRIIISPHGINGTLGGELVGVKEYVRNMNLTPEFKGIDYKWSFGSREDFPKLSIKVRKELVTLEPEEDFNVFDRGTPLRPVAWHQYLNDHPDAIILDARNEYESQVGAFKGAIKPKINTFKSIKKELNNLPKDKPVLTYCTGDIRCEYLSAYMKHQGFQNVFHLDGGIVKYGQTYGDDGHWEGTCYVFDKRLSITFSDQPKDISTCVHCGSKTHHQQNCSDPACNIQFVICENCAKDTSATCAGHANIPYTPK